MKNYVALCLITLCLFLETTGAAHSLAELQAHPQHRSHVSRPSKTAPSKTAMDRLFLSRTYQDGSTDEQMSRYVFRHTQDADTRRIAYTIMADLHRILADLINIAQHKQKEIPAGIGESNRKKVEALSKLSGQKMKNQYLQIVFQHHQEMVSLFNQEMEKGQDFHLKTFSAINLPTMERHTDMLANALKSTAPQLHH